MGGGLVDEGLYMQTSDRCLESYFTVPSVISSSSNWKVELTCSNTLKSGNGCAGLVTDGTCHSTDASVFGSFRIFTSGNTWFCDTGPSASDTDGRIYISYADAVGGIDNVVAVTRIRTAMLVYLAGGTGKTTSGYSSRTSFDFLHLFKAEGTTTNMRRIYGLKIYDGSSLLYDYVPGTYNGRPCWLDKVSDRVYFLPNQSDDSLFTVG